MSKNNNWLPECHTNNHIINRFSLLHLNCDQKYVDEQTLHPCLVRVALTSDPYGFVHTVTVIFNFRAATIGCSKKWTKQLVLKNEADAKVRKKLKILPTANRGSLQKTQIDFNIKKKSSPISSQSHTLRAVTLSSRFRPASSGPLLAHKWWIASSISSYTHQLLLLNKCWHFCFTIIVKWMCDP